MPNDDVIQTTAEAAESAALPRCGAVHADPSDTSAAEDKPLPEGMTKTPIDQKSPAEWAYERLILYIQNFEEQLDADHEVSMGMAGGAVGVLRIEGIGFFEPDLVTFYGTNELGLKTQLIQHVTQLNVTLSALPKMTQEAPARRIGFRLAADLDKPKPE
ncbi:hypothetical protein IV417_11575 [Alphaproteobacteria bacterium KMM 3653]|uniref:Uncharacterized protein n=1 Tax=Harenicola maris TaxID=2841044 RepID=A0AAP2CP57_9RHOB|nr:hypothetical protein [Harenicola maris]